MSDIVERLTCDLTHILPPTQETWRSLLKDAAAELTRLHAEVERLTRELADEKQEIETVRYWRDVALLKYLARAEKLEHANRTREDYDLYCTQCGRAHILDTVLPNEIWNQIAAPEDLLCTLCIDDRLASKGLKFDNAEFYYSGPALRSSLYDQHFKARAEKAEAALNKMRLPLMLGHAYAKTTYDNEGGEEAAEAKHDMGVINEGLTLIASLTEGE